MLLFPSTARTKIVCSLELKGTVTVVAQFNVDGQGDGATIALKLIPSRLYSTRLIPLMLSVARPWSATVNTPFVSLAATLSAAGCVIVTTGGTLSVNTVLTFMACVVPVLRLVTRATIVSGPLAATGVLVHDQLEPDREACLNEVELPNCTSTFGYGKPFGAIMRPEAVIVPGEAGT
jgi:hypothetical protein